MFEASGKSDIFIDIAPLMLEKLREAAHEQAKLNTYTWIAPGHVLALLETINELDAALADTTARTIRDAVVMRTRVARLEDDERERVARWMIANSLATGHGDTVDDLLNEASGQIAEMRARVAWATEWHRVAETICLLAGVSQGLGADEMVVAFRDTNDALRARVAKLEAAPNE